MFLYLDLAGLVKTEPTGFILQYIFYYYYFLFSFGLYICAGSSSEFNIIPLY